MTVVVMPHRLVATDCLIYSIPTHLTTTNRFLCGVVRIAFAIMTLGMSVDFAGLNTIVHYGAPCSLVSRVRNG